MRLSPSPSSLRHHSPPETAQGGGREEEGINRNESWDGGRRVGLLYVVRSSVGGKEELYLATDEGKKKGGALKMTISPHHPLSDFSSSFLFAIHLGCK